MEPQHLLMLALAAAVLAIGFTRRKPKALAFDDALLADVKRALEEQGFTIESYEHASVRGKLLTKALGVRYGDRVVGSLGPAKAGVSASIVVHGMKAPPAAFRIGRDRGRLPKNTVLAIDPELDARLVVHGSPDDAVRALIVAARGAVEALFARAEVTELRVLTLGTDGAVRVEATLARAALDVRAIADLARALADAIDA